MKRSEINAAIRDAMRCFKLNGWTLPPQPRWDVTDFGLDDFSKRGLVLINLAAEKEYCEKLMYARAGQTTPAHCHHQKKEDIIARFGALRVQVWAGHPDKSGGEEFSIQINGEMRPVKSGDAITLKAGERVTLAPGVYHAFYPPTDECIIGEVSTANDDLHDNFFVDQNIGRYPGIDEDEPPLVRLIGEK